VCEYLPSTDEQHHDHHAVHDGEYLLRRGIVMQKNAHDHRALPTFLLLQQQAPKPPEEEEEACIHYWNLLSFLRYKTCSRISFTVHSVHEAVFDQSKNL
jgi:hypothetical protein